MTSTGIAVGDYDNNGFVDFFFSNVGSTPPRFMVKGDLRDDQHFNPYWIFFSNKGSFEFEDLAVPAQLADYEFSWGAVMADLNLDGLEDLIVSENYLDWPLHKIPFLRLPGRAFLQNKEGQFAEISKKAGISNTGFSISPITADFNQDGYPDIVHVNLAGKAKAFLSKKGENNYLKVNLPDVVASIGAMTTVTTSSNKKIYQPFVIGEGLCGDQSHVLIFGLGNDKAIEINVDYLSKQSQKITGEFVNTVIEF